MICTFICFVQGMQYEGTKESTFVFEKRPDGGKDNFMPHCLQKTRRKALNTERTTPIYPDGGTHVGSAGQAVIVFGQ